MTGPLRTGAVGGLLALALSAPPSHAQDLEVTAQLTGRSLPPGYFARKRQQPDAFELRRGWIQRAQAVAAQQQVMTGTLPVVVVQALFADSPEPTVTAADLQQFLFDGPAPWGTLTDYYEEVSGGALAVTGQALEWVRTDITMAETVGTSYGLGQDARTGEWLVQALTRADPTVDFGQFDNDGEDGQPNSGDDDGYVDVVAVQFYEVSASCGGPAIWPHRWVLWGWTGSDFVTDDARFGGGFIRIDDYITQSVVDCDGEPVQKVGTIAHELGHVLGLPDLYDATEGIQPQQRRWVLGCWSLMAGGSWGCGQLEGPWNRPTHMSPWEKSRLGWVAVEDVGNAAKGLEFVLEPVQSSGRVLRVPLSLREYLLVEYRDRQGFDVDLPAGGVLIYHIDPTLPLRPCASCAKVYQVAMEEADANDGLIRTFLEGGNLGEAGDPFAVDGPASLTSRTEPSTRLNSGAASPVTLYSIVVDGGAARIVLSTAALTEAVVVGPLLDEAGPALPPEDADYLDRIGNQNGQYDVGDLRAYLTR